MDLRTTYMGIPLKNPLIVSACPLSEKLGNIKRMEDAGASAVVISPRGCSARASRQRSAERALSRISDLSPARSISAPAPGPAEVRSPRPALRPWGVPCRRRRPRSRRGPAPRCGREPSAGPSAAGAGAGDSPATGEPEIPTCDCPPGGEEATAGDAGHAHRCHRPAEPCMGVADEQPAGVIEPRQRRHRQHAHRAW
mgnify:CR=1 FL=1